MALKKKTEGETVTNAAPTAPVAVQEGTTMVETAPPQTIVTGKKTKTEKSGNLLVDIAHEIESTTKTKAINEALRLAEDIEVNYFKLGGYLSLILENNWFEGFPNFAAFVEERFGFKYRKAKYLCDIYNNLVKKQIPWEKVAGLGWTKLKDLAEILTPENVDEWVAKATPLSVAELLAVLKATPDGGSSENVPTTSATKKLTFKLKVDQLEVIQQALAKAKGELHTDYDEVALENICAGFVGGNSGVPQQSVEQFINSIGMDPLLNKIAEMFPMYDIDVTEINEDTKAQAQA